MMIMIKHIPKIFRVLTIKLKHFSHLAQDWVAGEKQCLEMKGGKKQVMKYSKKPVKNDTKKQKVALYARTSSKANEKSDSRQWEVDECGKNHCIFSCDLQQTSAV